jgi:hypothetical protein
LVGTVGIVQAAIVCQYVVVRILLIEGARAASWWAVTRKGVQVDVHDDGGNDFDLRSIEGGKEALEI